MTNRPRCYLCGPITKGNLANNVNQATAAFVALAKAGFAPFCPHWSVYSKPCDSDYELTPDHEFVTLDDRCECTGTRDGNKEMSHRDWLEIDLEWVRVSAAVLRLPGESTGADIETAHAVSLGIPVFHSVNALIEYFK